MHPKSAAQQPDSLVSAKVVAAVLGACRRTLGRRIYEPSPSGDEPILPDAKSIGQFGRKEVEMAPFDRFADQSPAFRTDLKAQSKRRRERLSSLACAPPLRRRNDLLPPLHDAI